MLLLSKKIEKSNCSDDFHRFLYRTVKELNSYDKKEDSS